MAASPRIAALPPHRSAARRLRNTVSRPRSIVRRRLRRSIARPPRNIARPRPLIVAEQRRRTAASPLRGTAEAIMHLPEAVSTLTTGAKPIRRFAIIGLFPP